MRRIVVTLLLASVHACGGGNSEPITSEAAREPCGDMCQADIQCGSEETLDACTARCATSVAGWAREDAFLDLAACVADLPCGSDDDQCAAMLSALAVHERWERECRAKLECGESELFCSIDSGFVWVKLLVPVIVEEMIDCLDDADCDARLTCIDNVFGKYHVDL